MLAQFACPSRFVRRTALTSGEYRKNFFQIDNEVVGAITSAEADQVTPLMSKVYLRLVNAPVKYKEREGVLRFEAELREGKLVKAWTVLCDVVGVASATANKALTWMHDQGVIGYYSGKNGVGIRIFLNRAASSIGVRHPDQNKNFLGFAHASPVERHASQNEAAFNDSFAVKEVSDTDGIRHAPKRGANPSKQVETASDENSERQTTGAAQSNPQPEPQAEHQAAVQQVRSNNHMLVDELLRRFRHELEPTLRDQARQAAAQEHERTRHWLEERGLPKAARVAQREAYNVLRQQGGTSVLAQRTHAELRVGCSISTAVAEQQRLRTVEEIAEVAEMCVALLEVQGKPVEQTLSEISAQGENAWLHPEDVPRVREQIQCRRLGKAVENGVASTSLVGSAVYRL